MSMYMEGAEPFQFEGSDVGVVVLHGFTGSTQSVRPLGEVLNQAYGFSVSGPCLAGHGTTPDDMSPTTCLDWLASAEQALKEMAARKRKVFVTGLSMGGTLTLNLAARFPHLVAAVAPINSPVGILDGQLAELVFDPAAPERIPGIGSDIKAEGVTELAYAELPVSCIREAFVLLAGTGDLLPKVKCPLLAVQSRVDHVVPPANGQRILSSVSSADVRALWLENSFHVATLDNDRKLIADSIGRFFTEHSA